MTFCRVMAILSLLALIVSLTVGDLRKIIYGSDELEPYTAKYSWLENQMSHAMMGFCLMAFYWSICVRSDSSTGTACSCEHAPESASTPAQPDGKWERFVRFLSKHRIWFPFLFVLIKDFVLDNTVDALRAWGSPVQPYWPAVMFDAITDDTFWWLGFSLVLFTIAFWNPKAQLNWKLWGLLAVVFLLLGIGFGGYWVAQKDSFDHSGLPLNYTRLANVAGKSHFAPCTRDSQHTALLHIQARARAGKPVHVIIYGGDAKERTDLAVSIGCEYVFRLSACGPWDFSGPTTVVHTSAVRLLEDGRTPLPVKNAPPSPVENSPAWKALRAETLKCLVVTDLDTSLAPPPDVLIEAAIKAQKPEIIGGGVNNQLDLASFLRTATGDLSYERDTLLTAKELEALKLYGKQHMLPRVTELKKVAENRTRPLRQLVSELHTQNVATVWSFNETPSWLGAACEDKDTEQRFRKADREAWRYSLAELLGISADDFYYLELQTPP